MKTIKAFLFILSFTLFGTVLYAQFDIPKYDRVMDLKDRQPIVIVNPRNHDIISRYGRESKPAVVKTYEQLIDNYNDAMETFMKKFWTFNSKEILYKTRDEITDMLRDKTQRGKYFVIYCYSAETSYEHDFDWDIDKHGKQVVGSYTRFAIGYPDEIPFYQVQLEDLIPSATYLAYFISSANYKFNYIFNHKDNPDMKNMVDANAHILASKTLLIIGDDVSPKVINDIHTYYPCNFKLVGDSEIARAVTSGDSSFAYILHCNGSTSKIGELSASNDMNWVVNCADGATLGYTKKGTEFVGFSNDQGLRKDFFQDIAEFCNAGKKK